MSGAVLLLLLQVINPVLPAEVAPPPEGAYTIVALPDTQYYSVSNPELLKAQVDWIVRNREARKIRFVVHLGDMVQNNSAREWKVFRDAYRALDGKVPYSLAPGNHDLGRRGRADSRETKMAEYFPVEHFRGMKTFGGVYDKEPESPANSFHLLEAGGRKWLVLALEFGPRDDVLRWANEVVAKHPSRRVLMTTHAYINMDGRRYDRERGGLHGFLNRYAVSRDAAGFNDGRRMWEKLVSRHANFGLVLCGHTCVAARISEPGEHGNVVHQMLVDYQIARRGGDGWMRLLEFDPDGVTLRVRDYSPSLDRYNLTPRTHFTVKLNPLD